MSEESSRKAVVCPACGAPSRWHEANPYRPFCSERCKLIDLGQWASEGYRIPASDKGNDDPENDGNSR